MFVFAPLPDKPTTELESAIVVAYVASGEIRKGGVGETGYRSSEDDHDIDDHDSDGSS